MLDEEELYDKITFKYKEATELINHLVDIGEDIFDISNGKQRKEQSDSEKEFYTLVVEAKRKLYQTREKVLKANIKRYWNTFGNWSKSISNREK